MLRNNLVQALDLYHTYVNSVKDGKVDNDTLIQMKSIFHNVADDDKGFVFGVFLQFLRDDGVQFDVTQMQDA